MGPCTGSPKGVYHILTAPRYPGLLSKSCGLTKPDDLGDSFPGADPKGWGAWWRAQTPTPWGGAAGPWDPLLCVVALDVGFLVRHLCLSFPSLCGLFIFCCGVRCSQFSFSKNFSICSCRFCCIHGQGVFLCSGSYYATILDPPPQIILYSVIMRHLGKISRTRCYEIVTLNSHPLLDSLLFLLFLLCAISLIIDQEHVFLPSNHNYFLIVAISFKHSVLVSL